MATEIKLPELGENLEGGDVLDVKVKPGATVAKGQTLLEIEAEKSTVEVPAPLAGRIAELRVKRGDHIRVGQTVCLIEGSEQKGGEKKTEPVQTVSEAANEPEPAGPAATPEEPTRREKVAAAQAVKEKPSGDGRKEVPERESQPVDGELVPAGPATRRLARELGVDLHQVPGSAPGGRVTEEDVKEYVRQLASGAGGRMGAAAAPPLPDFGRWGPVERQPLDGVRRRVAEQMALGWSLVPQVTQYDQTDITDLDSFRRKQEGGGPKLTVTAFALKAAAIALKHFPTFNASLDSTAGQLILKRYYHIGVAVDTDRGLLVPVLRDVDKKSVLQLAQELVDIAERARQKKLSADEMRGGTFTISNLGGIGGTAFSPIVNYPEVAILGLARSRLEPVVRDGQIVPRLLLPLCLTYDHRVIDGGAAARFTRRLAELLESPLQMLLHS